MNIQVKQTNLQQTEGDTLLIVIPEITPDHTPDSILQTVDDALNQMVTDLIKAGDIAGKSGEFSVLYTQGALPVKRIIIAGSGETGGTDDIEQLRRAIATGVQRASKLNTSHLVIATPASTDSSLRQSVQAISEASLLTLYHYHGQKSSDPSPASIEQITIIIPETGERTDAEAGLAAGKAFAEGAIFARDLVNLPPNYCTPSHMAQQAVEMAESVGLKARILETGQIKSLKMGALLAVAQGSDTPPRFIILEHNADRAGELDTLVLVGKGVTFDTGGYSLKTRDGMIGMKADMGGGAAVLGAMKTVAMLDVPFHVVGLVPAADNMISGNAYRPQEVITASNGKTIEIISTDAEGRMLLADALVYASRYEPNAVVDIATLTGGAVVALGSAAAALFSTDDKLRDRLIRAGDATHERVWQMPLYEEYKKLLESDTADFKNSGGRSASACSAATFLKNFVSYPAWAHVDMAGMAASADGPPYVGKGATGFGARLLAEFVRSWGD